MQTMKLVLRVAVGVLLRLFTPGCAGCRRCLWPWVLVTPHDTLIVSEQNWSRYQFSLCERCWRQLSARERLPYYKRGWSSNSALREPWEVVEAAVLAEAGLLQNFNN
jgi:hypothetical protein